MVLGKTVSVLLCKGEIRLNNSLLLHLVANAAFKATLKLLLILIDFA